MTSPLFGADDYLNKPFELATLEHMLIDLVGVPSRTILPPKPGSGTASTPEKPPL